MTRIRRTTIQPFRPAGRAPRFGTAIAGLVLAGCLCLAACSSSGPSASETSGSRDTAPPKECRDAGSGKTDKASEQKCAQEKFELALDADGTKGLADMLPADRLGLGREMCEIAARLKAQEGDLPLRGDVVGGAAEKWSVDDSDVEAVVKAAKSLCPKDIGVVVSLPVTAGPVPVELLVEGGGDITVTYTNDKGKKSTDRSTAPWVKTITLTEPIGISVDVRAESSAKVRCAIVVADRTISDQTFASVGDSVSCRATKDQIVTAANSNWTGSR